MRIVVFGLSISSAWGNGHATLLRGLFRALHSYGHEVHFFERDAPYYASHRDAESFPFVHLHLYSDWQMIAPLARRLLTRADLGMVTSYCPDGAAACELVLDSTVERSAFYDMDTPVTLDRIERGEAVPYLPKEGLGGFDMVLSYTGGKAVDRLREQLSARRVSTLYGWVDPESYARVEVSPWFESDLTYLGTYSADRQQALEELLIKPARHLPQRRFVVGGAMYPEAQSWPPNVRYYHHVAPPEHCRFYSSSPLTLSVTRASMAALGYCPSGRIFEAAACGTAVLSDWWEGLDAFFEPGKEILIARSTEDATSTLAMDKSEIARIGARAKERTLDCHTSYIRARQLLYLLGSASRDSGTPKEALVEMNRR